MKPNKFDFFYRLLHSQVINFATGMLVLNMQEDQSRPGYIMYSTPGALLTTNGVDTILIAGDVEELGYREGTRGDARFNVLSGFSQVGGDFVVVMDSINYCIRLVNSISGDTSVFSGDCTNRGVIDGDASSARFEVPFHSVIDSANPSQILVLEAERELIRTVDLETGTAGTFYSAEDISNDFDRGTTNHVLQDHNNDLYISVESVSFNAGAIFKLTYEDRIATLITGSVRTSGLIDGSLLDARFSNLRQKVFLSTSTMLVADFSNNLLRLIDIEADGVASLDLCSGCLNFPYSLLLTNDALYVGTSVGITQFVCKFNFDILRSTLIKSCSVLIFEAKFRT